LRCNTHEASSDVLHDKCAGLRGVRFSRAVFVLLCESPALSGVQRGNIYFGPHACACGAAGTPLPSCNKPSGDEPPRLPKGLQPDNGEGSQSVSGTPKYIRHGTPGIETPAQVAKAFVRDMKAFFKAKDQLKQDEIAARRHCALQQYQRPRAKKLRLT